MLLLVFFIFALILAQDTSTSNNACPSGYQALSEDPYQTCANSFRFSRACTPFEPCEVEDCAEFCEQSSDCIWFFHNSRRACNLLNSCDVTRFSTYPGTTCQKIATDQPISNPSKVPTSNPSAEPSLSPTGNPTRAPSNCPTAVPSRHPTFDPTGHPTLNPTTTTEECRVRRSWMSMSTGDREHFINVYKQVSQTQAYRAFTTQHTDEFNRIHVPEQFLSWHRYYLWVVENWLREIDPELTVPFWAWEEDAGEDWIWNNDSELWGPEPYAFGSISSENEVGEYTVTDGPFACGSWTLGNDECLTRRQPRGNRRPADEVWLQSLISDTSLDHEAFRAAINGPHGEMHCMIGGSMCHPSTSAYTPDFLLHHSNVDRQWDLWQKYDEVNMAKESTQTGIMNGMFEDHAFTAKEFNDAVNQPGGVCVVYEDTSIQDRRRALLGELDRKRFVTSMVRNFPDDQAFYNDLLHTHDLPIEFYLTFKANGMIETAKRSAEVLSFDRAMILAREQIEKGSGIHDSLKVAPGDYRAPFKAAAFFTKRSGVTVTSVLEALIEHDYVAEAAQFAKDLQTLAESFPKAEQLQATKTEAGL